jgi:hypothetical protein
MGRELGREGYVLRKGKGEKDSAWSVLCMGKGA